MVKLGNLGLIEPEVKAQEEKAIITADRVLTELAYLATVDISKAFDKAGNLLPIQDMPEDMRRAIVSIEVEVGKSQDGKETTKTIRVKLWDKNKSLETIAKHLKMLTDKIEHSGNMTLENLIAGSYSENEAK